MRLHHELEKIDNTYPLDKLLHIDLYIKKE